MKDYKEDIEKIENISNKEELLEMYPNAKSVQSRTFCTYYEIYNEHFVKFYHYHTDGRCMNEVTSYKIEDVKFEEMKATYFYFGMVDNYIDIKSWM